MPECYEAHKVMIARFQKLHGIHDFFDILHEFFLNGASCFKSEDDIEKYVKHIAEIFNSDNLEDTLTNMLLKRKSLTKLFESTVEAFKAHNYKKAGDLVGRMLFIALNPPKEEEDDFVNTMMVSFLNMAQIPIQKKDCSHAESGALNDIELTQFYLEEPAAKGKVNNIHIQGTMKEY